MDTPRFYRENINSELVGEEIGDAFQRFTHELLRYDHPDLHIFPGGGKDGAIDISHTVRSSRIIVECKHIGKDGLTEAHTRWRGVARHLEEHLIDEEGPTKSQAQYGPWYRTDPTIREYIFCVSSVLSNQEQIDQLRDEIAAFFRRLGEENKHLAHLADLTVKVIDWNDLSGRLLLRPHLLFRWFPIARPQGLVPLSEWRDRGTFRSYLSSEKLPYYSRTQHLKYIPAPTDTEVLEEEALLAQLDEGSVTGLVVTGAGGVGKTRLTLELGRLAQSKDWTVLRVQSRLKEDALERLAERLTPDHKVLLLIDYIETQRDFLELMETLNDLNESMSLHLRYIANCRTSYYQTVASTSRHKPVDLSPNKQGSDLDWFEKYQQQTVRHILEQTGIEVTESHLIVCRDIPVLAVFVSYLHSTGRQLQIIELLRETDFSIWVRKRMQLSFGKTIDVPIIARNLAILLALFPMPDSSHRQLDKGDYRILFDNLATDGWIEKLPADGLNAVESWVTAHDVLADQILVSYLAGIPHTIEPFIHEVFTQAYKVGCLRSAFMTLQRLVTQPILGSLNWFAILSREMTAEPIAWREVRDILVRTPLLLPSQIIALLGEYEEVWRGAEEEVDFQNALGWLACWAFSQDELDSAYRPILVSWIQKAASKIASSNLVLTYGIRLCPEVIQELALEWILTRPRLFQTHYLLVAWLKQKLPTEAIVSSVQEWAAKFRAIPHLSFVVGAWLDAGGEKELVRDHVAAWLYTYEVDAEAQFVYGAWLDAGGDKELVRGHIVAWLAMHEADPEAQFVYKAWLDAGGEKELARAHIAAWLATHEADAEARFVYQAWLDADGEKELVHDHIAAWLGEHEADAEADFVYKAWLDAGGEKELVRDHVAAWLTTHEADAEASFVYKAWLDADGDKNLVQEPLIAWLGKHGTDAEADFIFKAWLDAGGDFSVIRSLAILWLNKNYEKVEAVFITKFLAK